MFLILGNIYKMTFTVPRQYDIQHQSNVLRMAKRWQMMIHKHGHLQHMKSQKSGFRVSAYPASIIKI